VKPLSLQAVLRFGRAKSFWRGFKMINDAAAQRRFGADHDEINLPRLAERGHGVIGGIECNDLGVSAMPAFPGAKSRSHSGLAAIFHANACSRPPEPGAGYSCSDH
jgi:hypothetical protein